MPTLSAKFLNPWTLRSIRRDLLLAWLRPSAGYLESRGLVLPEMQSGECRVQNERGHLAAVPEMQNADPPHPTLSPCGEGGTPGRVDYDKLAEIFLNPTAAVPEQLLESLFLIQEMGTEQGMNLLLAGAEAHGIDLGDREDLSPADVAVQFWLINPELLERMQHSLEFSRRKAFRYYSTDAKPVPPFAAATQEQIAALEKKLSNFYVAWKCGKAAKVSPYKDQREWLFIVRHGGRWQQEGAIEDGEVTSVGYRPVKHDVLKYDDVRGEMGINCCAEYEEKALLAIFGSCLFGRHDFFPGIAKYSLAPLLHGRGCLACMDIPGMESVSLVGVQFCIRDEPWKVVTHKARDIFELIEMGQLVWPEKLEYISQATFKIRFRRTKGTRQLTIQPCNRALYSRNCNTHILESWMQARGYIVEPSDDPTSATVREFPAVASCGLGVAA